MCSEEETRSLSSSILCIVCIVYCKCVVWCCHRVSTQLRLNKYHIISICLIHKTYLISLVHLTHLINLIYLLTYLLTYSMVQSPSWEANCFAASQEIPRILRNPKVHYRTHKRPPPSSILGQPNPVHIPTSHLLEIRPNIIHPSTPRSPRWSPSLRFPQQDPIHPLSSPICATCPAHGWGMFSGAISATLKKEAARSSENFEKIIFLLSCLLL